jgi:hypothetical protein
MQDYCKVLFGPAANPKVESKNEKLGQAINKINFDLIHNFISHWLNVC